jgi:predicted RNA-binding protein
MQYFCLITSDQDSVAAYEVLKKRLSKSEWFLYKNTLNKEKVKIDDKVIFYTAGKNKMAQHFVARAAIDQLDKTLDDNNKINEIHIKLKDIKLFENPVLVDLLINNLDFIKHKNNLGVNLQGGCRIISENDYNLISNYKT